MSLWKFKSFKPIGQPSVVKLWADSSGDDALATFDTRLEFLGSQPIEKWVRPYTGKLTDECNGLIEIRFEVRNVQHRPLGFFGPGRMEFTILLFAIEKGGKFDPLDACSIAFQRMREINNKKALAHEFTLE